MILLGSGPEQTKWVSPPMDPREGHREDGLRAPRAVQYREKAAWGRLRRWGDAAFLHALGPRQAELGMLAVRRVGRSRLRHEELVELLGAAIAHEPVAAPLTTPEQDDPQVVGLFRAASAAIVGNFRIGHALCLHEALPDRVSGEVDAIA